MIPQSVLDPASHHARIAASVGTDPDTAVIWDGRRFRYYAAADYRGRTERGLLPAATIRGELVAIVKPDGTAEIFRNRV